jgi:hypothetical protein
MLKIVAALAALAALGGCAVTPGYGYEQPYDPNYGYAPGYYAPAYGTVNIWSGGGGYYRGYHGGYGRGGHWRDGGHWNGGGHGGGHWNGGGHGGGHGGGRGH